MPAHAGTLDVDIVIDLQILADTAGYRTLEENLRAMGFERSTNERGQRLSWRWQTRTESGALMAVELLADAPEIAGGRVEPLPTKGSISALNIPHSSIVFEMHHVAEIRAELLGGAGYAVELVRHADLVSFTCLKAFAFDQRFERKDAHDLVYCIEHAEEGLDGAARMFRGAWRASTARSFGRACHSWETVSQGTTRSTGTARTVRSRWPCSSWVRMTGRSSVKPGCCDSGRSAA